MIYKYVTNPTEARNDLASFYEDILMDELADNSGLTTPEAYLIDVRNDAKGQVDNFGNDCEKDIRKACDQVSTLKLLRRSFDEARMEPQEFIALRK
jgi:hypothetical protein